MEPSPDPGQKCTAISRKVFIKSARNKPERYCRPLTLRVETMLLNNNDTPFCP